MRFIVLNANPRRCILSPFLACLSLIVPPTGDAAASPSAALESSGAVETFFGQTVSDPYRRLENVADPEVVAYMRAEGARTRAQLDALPGRTALLARIEQLSQATVSISGLQVAGSPTQPRFFYYKLAPGVNARQLFVRDGLKGRERLVFDPAALAGDGKRYSLDSYRASPDGKHVAVGVAAGGSEETVLRIIEIGPAASRDTGVAIDRIGFADMTHWQADSRGFFYNRLPPAASGAVNRYLNAAAYRHLLGRSPARDELLMDRQSPGVALADIDIPSVMPGPDGKSLVARVEHGDAREISIFTADAADIGKPLRWRRIVQPADEVTQFALHGGAIYLLTRKNAPRFKIVRTGLRGADFGRATTIVPHGDTVIAEMRVAQDALYIRELFGGVDRLQRLNFSNVIFSGGKLEFVRLPFDLAIRQLVTSPNTPGALLRLESWTEGPKYVQIEARTGNLADTHLHPKSSADFSDIVELRLNATAKDGVKVPVSLVYRKNTQLNGVNPTLLRAYGAYGIVQAPAFNPAALAWLERGGIMATCHVRGGGEFGDEWHRAGQKLNKPNTWRDLIACAEFLIAQRFTSADHMAIQGGSAGGIAIGRAMTERPDLFAAAIPAVGVLDTLRAEFTPNGPPNVPEFGSVATEDGFRGLLAMSSYHAVRDGSRYPAVLLMHGVNDPRVEVWHSTKMAARLGKAVRDLPDANPILLRLDYDAGHGIGTARSQRNAELADIYAFALWRFRDPGFQPKPTPRE